MTHEPVLSFPEGFIRSNWTEIFGNSQAGQIQIGNAVHRCSDMQMNALMCLEAYGAKRGRQVCTDYLNDYTECIHHRRQYQRVAEMRKERIRQVMRGERKLSDFHDKVKPPRDSFQSGPFHP